MLSVEACAEKKNIEIAKAKGIKTRIVKNFCKMKNYENCLLGSGVDTHTFSTLISKKHQIQQQIVTKKGLSPFDSKRYILNDGIHTLPYGHYKIPELNM